MRQPLAKTFARRRFTLLIVALVGMTVLSDASPSAAQKKAGKKAEPPKPVAPPAPRSALLTHEAWQSAPLTQLEPGEIDQLIAREQQADKISPAPLTTDEQFIRRVALDLTGRLPAPADVRQFVANPDSQKRAKLIDKLLESDDYAQHWARYWRDVIASRINDFRGRGLVRSFEQWLGGQLKSNQGWDTIARAMITATGPCRYEDEGQNGAVFFLASHFGADAATERAAETARVFLGIQIQCAQCHDHPSDQWKRVQFHELTGYFARLNEQLLREDKRNVGVQLVSRPRGEHEMPSTEDPRKMLVAYPRFLDGKSPGQNLGDKERRRALANAIVDKNNYWFAGAYINRIWGELMGQSFYQPVDDMGPQKEAVFPSVLTRLTGAFRGTNYDIKAMFRAILNSQAYQRQIRLGESAEQHLHFAAAYPTRLRADAIWDSLTSVLGEIGVTPNPKQPRPNPRQGFQALFKAEFAFDPSLKADEVEGSIPQALMMMNNPLINQRIQAKGNNFLARILKSSAEDDEALRRVYLCTLARKPTDREMDQCRTYLKQSNNRAEGFEDILWSLLNSTEFQTKR